MADDDKHEDATPDADDDEGGDDRGDGDGGNGGNGAGGDANDITDDDDVDTDAIADIPPPTAGTPRRDLRGVSTRTWTTGKLKGSLT
jgi:hypothetical protein